MLRSLAVVVAAGVAVATTGCFSLFKTGSPVVSGKVVETPTLTPAAADAADRVSAVGADLLAATPLGIPEVDFFAVGSPDPELFHQSANIVYISDGLVKRCRTDGELAAVLATEVGRLTAEFRRAARKESPDPIPAAAESSRSNSDPARDLYLAQFEKDGINPVRKRLWPTVDANEIAADLLRNAGHDPKLLVEVAPLVREASAGGKASKQFLPTKPPTWTR